jgi:hypothetical protein
MQPFFGGAAQGYSHVHHPDREAAFHPVACVKMPINSTYAIYLGSDQLNGSIETA